MKKIKEKRGSQIVESAFTTYILIALVLIAISIFSVLVEFQTVNNIADQLAVYVEYQGQTNNLQSEFNRLAQRNKLQGANYSINVNGRIMLQQPFEIEVTCNKSIGLGGIKVNIPIRATSTGRGMVYWK